jgi:hypothetical protein
VSDEFQEGIAWANFAQRVVRPFESLEDSYAIQVWCEQTFGTKWATTPPDSRSQTWYFVDETAATLFRLRWC